MEKGIFRFILRYSLRDQITLVLMSAAALPFLYLILELPKTIVNQAIGGTDFPHNVLGTDFGQIPYLLLLCGLFLVLVIISGALKFFTSTYRYRVGDRLLRRLRFDMIERVMRFPSSEFRNISSGQIVSMITAETANLGFFIAEAFAVPAIALGTLATIVLFMFMQNWMMGVAAIALYPLQIYLIPKLQKQINALQRKEVQEQRGVSQRINDVVTGVNEIHGHDTAQYELADFSRRLGVIYDFRTRISSKRYLTNILNQFFSQLTPFFFLSLGGYLVIVGEISLGSLVAVLAAYKDMYSPWKDLIDYYQKAEDARVRYDQLKEVFARDTLSDKAMIEAEPGEHDFTGAQLVVENVVVEKDEGVRVVDGASIKLTLPTHAAILGSGGSGRDEFARLLARQESPQSGSILLGDKNLSSMPDSVAGRRIGYISSQTHLGSGSIRDVLTYPLLRRPRSHALENIELSREELKFRAETIRAGNSAHDISSNWVDYEAAGCADSHSLDQRMIEILRLVNLDQEVYEIGCRLTISPEKHPDLAARLVEARGVFLQRLEAEKWGVLIEAFDPDTYNSHASIAENILFGSPIGPSFEVQNLAENDYVLQVLEQVGLTRFFLETGRKLAATEVEIFNDLPPGHEFFERFSFINAENLPAFKAILRSVESSGFESLDEGNRKKLMALPFRLVEAQHHVDLIDDEMEKKLLAARRAFAGGLPDTLRGSIQFFDRKAYNASSNILENIVFGKPASSKAGSSSQIGQIVAAIVEELDLRDTIIACGLDYQVGMGGTRLSVVQRQKIALARCLVKRPDILIMSDALSTLDLLEQEDILLGIKEEMKGRSLILFESDETHRREFEKVLMMDQGRITHHHQLTGSEPPPEGAILAGEDTQDASHHTVNLNEIVAMLMEIPMFRGIGRSKLKLLAFASERKHFEQGQEVFHQGDSGNHAFVVMEGEAEVVLELEGGEKTVATLGRSEIFGEMALLSKIPRTTTIRAKTPLVLLSVSQEVFLRMVEENSDIAIAMMRMLAERLASTLHEYGKVMMAEESPEKQLKH